MEIYSRGMGIPEKPKNGDFSDGSPEAIYIDFGLQNGTKKHKKSLKNVSGSKKRDFVKILLFLQRQHDFHGSGAPEID